MEFARRLEGHFGLESRDRRAFTTVRSVEGARAALESFYFAFNAGSRAALADVLATGSLVSLNNPLGGIVRGQEAILALYDRIFAGPVRVWVEFNDIVEYASESTVVFAGREAGEYQRGDRVNPLRVRTTRVYQFLDPVLGWRQVHHHGSIDDSNELEAYQRALRS